MLHVGRGSTSPPGTSRGSAARSSASRRRQIIYTILDRCYYKLSIYIYREREKFIYTLVKLDVTLSIETTNYLSARSSA